MNTTDITCAIQMDKGLGQVMNKALPHILHMYKKGYCCTCNTFLMGERGGWGRCGNMLKRPHLLICHFSFEHMQMLEMKALGNFLKR